MSNSKRSSTSALFLKAVAVSSGSIVFAGCFNLAIAQTGQASPAAATAQAPAVQPAPLAQAVTTPAQPVDPKSKVVCRQRVEIGTRLGKRRECLTLREWEQIRARSAEEAKRMQRNMGDKRG